MLTYTSQMLCMLLKSIARAFVSLLSMSSIVHNFLAVFPSWLAGIIDATDTTIAQAFKRATCVKFWLPASPLTTRRLEDFRLRTTDLGGGRAFKMELMIRSRFALALSDLSCSETISQKMATSGGVTIFSYKHDSVVRGSWLATRIIPFHTCGRGPKLAPSQSRQKASKDLPARRGSIRRLALCRFHQAQKPIPADGTRFSFGDAMRCFQLAGEIEVFKRGDLRKRLSIRDQLHMLLPLACICIGGCHGNHHIPAILCPRQHANTLSSCGILLLCIRV